MKKIRKKVLDIDNVLFERSSRARRMNISIKPWRGVRVAVPRGISFKYAEKRFLEKIDWVREKLQTIEEIENERPVYGLSGQIETNYNQLRIIKHNSSKLQIDQDEDLITLKVPQSLGTKDPRIQSKIREILIAIYRAEAKYYLPQRVQELARKYNFRYNRVYIKCQKTLWGSCSGKLNINLNLNLMRLDPELRDYVIMHELVHTEIRNHSDKFWKRLSQYIDQPRKKAKQLKEHYLKNYMP